ncbi:unnamed protein product [Clavelina lepadiformis]|uniref:Large ribosomal subunit protein mL38 n=1 Tax=Clavelina lepadiformis TaxID=159417 RepID=A0ABP0FWG6_CLALP
MLSQVKNGLCSATIINFYVFRSLRSGYRLKPGCMKSGVLEVNKTGEQKYQEQVADAMLHKRKSPLQGFERVHVTLKTKGNDKLLPNEPFYGRNDLPTYGSYKNYAHEAERMRRENRDKKLFWKTMDHWLKVQKADPNFIDIGMKLPSQKLQEHEVKAIKREIKKILLDPQREKAARKRNLNVDIDQFLEDWEGSPDEARDVFNVAHHYNIYRDLFGHGHFYPVVPMNIAFPGKDELLNPVYYGNEISPSEAASTPEVSFVSKPDNLWSLIVTNPDEHLEDNDKEYLHWFVANIKGNDLLTGEQLIDYLPPFPARGTGYHRMVFLLFQQTRVLDFSSERRNLPCCLLRNRTFKTKNFYKKFQVDLIPASVRFFQTKWDESVQKTFHKTFDMPEPVYDFIPKEIERLGQLKTFPHRKPLTWLKKFMPKEPIYPGGGAFT